VQRAPDEEREVGSVPDATQEEDDAEKIRRSQEPGFKVPGNEIEMRNINPIHYEPVGPEVANQAESGDCVVIDGLEKTYDNGF
jgi:hypothetical protein